MNTHPFPDSIKQSRVMVFVDGENLAIRYGKVLGTNPSFAHVSYEPNVFVWSGLLNMHHHVSCEVTRRYYYTSVQGDNEKLASIHDRLQDLGIEAPRVFKKNKERGSKQVDISLSVEMLSHAHRGNYDAAVLVAGDEDYVPLVDAVAAAGRRVFLWFVKDGLSPVLRRRADHFYDLDRVLFDEHADRYFR
jgi:uncharacterized LabA/DUF88 family protein